MPHKICVIKGDGVGPELIEQSLRVLEALALNAVYEEAEAGYACYQKNGSPIPDATIESCKYNEVVLFSAITTPPNIPNYKSAIVSIRRALELYANIRPMKTYPGVPCLKENINFTIFRENTEGEYSGVEGRSGDTAFSMRVITRKASERIQRKAFDFARASGKKKVTLIHKANVLRESDGLWREVALGVAKEYASFGIEMEEVIVDAMAMRLIKEPEKFSIIVAPNLFGDILSDEAAQLVGGLGMTPSANIGDKYALFEPTHGSAPKYTGQNVVNPLAQLLSVKMMLEHLGESGRAEKLENAIINTLQAGIKTKDIGGTASTSEVVDAIISRL
ncbi:Homoisocitrate dehydrogenase [Candidatus Gugararchaeum adminiculabundum]|nr:Homoisocitrate dehydrogenase [Candidatus Gugararchaeum adminiculabundum]